jgi:hypothetical protein
MVAAFIGLRVIARWPGINWYTAQKVQKGMSFQQACDLLQIPESERHSGWAGSHVWKDNRELGEWYALPDPGELRIHVGPAGIVDEVWYEPTDGWFSLDTWQMWLHDLGL